MSRRPSAKPSNSEEPSDNPTNSEEPSDHPTQSEEPSEFPTQSEEPSENPTQSEEPSEFPTQSEEPSEFPTQSEEPTDYPTFFIDVIPINPNDPPVLVVDCVTLLDIICAPENAGILGTFCTALLITGLAPGLELGCAGGNRRRYQDNPNIPLEAQRIIDQYNQNYPGNNYIPAEAQRYINQYYRPANIGNRLLQYPGNNNYIPAQTQAIIDQYTPGNINNYVGNQYNNGNNYNYNGINAPLQHTVFGPTNDAFIKLGDTTLRRLFNTVEGQVELTEILFYHIIQGSRLDFHQLNCGQSYTMLNEQPTTSRCRAGDNINGIARKFQVGTGNGNNVDNWPELIAWDNMAVNGVLHVVDEVILHNNVTPSPSVSF